MSSPQNGQQHPEYGQAYDPYGGRDPYNNRGFDIPNPYTAQQPPPPVARPGSMVGALVLLVVGALPWVLLGLGLLVAPITNEEIAATGVLSAPELAGAGLTAETLISALRTIGVIMLIVPVLYIVFAVLAFTGRNWARVLVTVITAALLLFLVLGLFGGGGVAGAGTALVIVFAVVPAVGVGLMFTTASSAWFASLRK